MNYALKIKRPMRPHKLIQFFFAYSFPIKAACYANINETKLQPKLWDNFNGDYLISLKLH